MVKTFIETATTEHVQAILPSVRQADIDEFIAASGQTPEEVLNLALRVSTRAWAGIADGNVVNIFGVAPASLLGGKGIPWMVGSDHIDLHKRAFLKGSRLALVGMLELYPHLENYVDQRNHLAKAWLHWLGFKLEDPAPYGVQGLPFHRFHMEKR
ncbi:hypothetical protein FH968_04415 [Buttiauxella sp. B2]|uniref:hypothetical protein n=1 Tax=Buttiauxella sp. B2 TaxID=2587812 RepID=UPI00111D5719|nr:hypothetical protein [Buttiauxella sp. B2]TNV22124.1 hypothetical protein FH968_04415 [Buttiauxella sp. B2]